jgi:hypothetical protein
MNRHAVIISNPGEVGEENYCAGVLKDVVNYHSFLLSAMGGLWLESEIIEMRRPSVAEVRMKVKGLSVYGYVLVVFSGHGWHSAGIDSTALVLRKGEAINSAELRLPATKQTLVLDCCREKLTDRPMLEQRDFMKVAKAWPTLHPANCRKFYDKRIEECPGGLVVMYACNAGQVSGDHSQNGGYYSYNLLEASKGWAHDSTIDTSRTHDIFSVVQGHNAAIPLVERLAGARQTPQIEKPRTGPYYPFCIVA